MVISKQLGRALPINTITDKVANLAQRQPDKNITFDEMLKSKQSEFIAKLLKLCLRANVSERVEYAQLQLMTEN